LTSAIPERIIRALPPAPCRPQHVTIRSTRP